jgi:hypothetical protein
MVGKKVANPYQKHISCQKLKKPLASKISLDCNLLIYHELMDVN